MDMASTPGRMGILTRENFSRVLGRAWGYCAGSIDKSTRGNSRTMPRMDRGRRSTSRESSSWVSLGMEKE